MAREGRVHRTVLVNLMSQSLGDQKASELIVTTAARLGMSTFDFSPEEAQRLLEELTQEEGLVGISAMLAKTRLPRVLRAQAEAAT